MTISAPEKVAAEIAFERPLPGKWFARPRPVRWTFRKLPTWGACVWMPYCIWTFVDDYTHTGIPDWAFKIFVVLTDLFVLLGISRLVSNGFALMKRRRDRAFSDLPAGIDEIPVEVVFGAEKRYLGIDRGILWFEGGLMHFNGESTSFVLAPNDIQGPKKKRSLDAQKKRAKGLLRMRSEPQSTFIQVRPLFGFGIFKYRRQLRKFLHGNDVEARPRQWPPMEPYGR